MTLTEAEFFAALGGAFRYMFGPAPVAQRTEDEARWEDDGGAVPPTRDGYEQVWAPVP